ncbi:hypothetical protein BH10PLA1_BH10PLA1_15330 [soil metagenome]
MLIMVRMALFRICVTSIVVAILGLLLILVGYQRVGFISAASGIACFVLSVAVDAVLTWIGHPRRVPRGFEVVEIKPPVNARK